MKKLIGIGENICDQYINEQMSYPGGQTANVTVYAKKQGFETGLLSVFGTDPIGKWMKSNFDQMGIDTSHSRVIDGEHGYVCVNYVHGERRFVRANRGGVLHANPIVLSEDDLMYLKGYDLVYTSQMGHAQSQLPIIKEKTDLLIGYDFNSFTWKDDSCMGLVPYIDYAFMAVDAGDEEKAVTVAKQMADQGVRYVILTYGMQGESVFFDGCRFDHRPQPIQTKDALGAGDAFAAGFMCYTLVHEMNADRIIDAMIQGEQMAAKACLKDGAYGMGKRFSEVRPVVSAEEGDIDPRKYREK